MSETKIFYSINIHRSQITVTLMKLQTLHNLSFHNWPQLSQDDTLLCLLEMAGTLDVKRKQTLKHCCFGCEFPKELLSNHGSLQCTLNIIHELPVSFYGRPSAYSC